MFLCNAVKISVVVHRISWSHFVPFFFFFFFQFIMVLLSLVHLKKKPNKPWYLVLVPEREFPILAKKTTLWRQRPYEQLKINSDVSLCLLRTPTPSWKEIARNKSQLVTQLLRGYDKRIRPYTGGNLSKFLLLTILFKYSVTYDTWSQTP